VEAGKMKCSFCASKITDGTGTMYVKKSGSLLYFCKQKCEKNMLKLNRNPVKFKWASKKKKVEGIKK
jgi:large subunit ribosomal protein L24e